MRRSVQDLCSRGATGCGVLSYARNEVGPARYWSNVKEECVMRKITTGLSALAFGLALGLVPAVAQNMQGPAATGYGAGSNPQSGGTVGEQPSAGAQQPSGQSTGMTSHRRVYNYAPHRQSKKQMHPAAAPGAATPGANGSTPQYR